MRLARGDREGARSGYEAAALALERGAQHWRCIAEQRLGRLDLENGQLDQAVARFTTMRDIAVGDGCRSAKRRHGPGWLTPR